MRYTLLLYSNPADFADATPEQMQEMQSLYGTYIEALNKAGVFIDTDWLQPDATGTTVSVRDGERRIQDGSFPDTKEQLGGYFVINVENLDDALDWAAQCPAADYGHVEVRPSAFPQDNDD